MTFSKRTASTFSLVVGPNQHKGMFLSHIHIFFFPILPSKHNNSSKALDFFSFHSN